MTSLLVNALDCFAFSLLIYVLIAFRDHRRRRGLSYPPGPPSYPIIGNLLDVPKESPWSAYRNMSRQYGEVIGLHVFGQPVVVLCSLSTIKDLIEKRGELYAHRPIIPIRGILNMDWLLSGINGELWREGRKLLDRSLRPSAIISYRQMMQENARKYIPRLLATPREFPAHIHLLQGKLIMSLTYGYDPKEGDDMIAAPVKAAALVSRVMLPGAAMVNIFPFLRYIPSWVPWLSYEPLVREGRRLSKKMKNDPIDFVKNAMRTGTAIHSLASQHLQEIEDLASPERQKKEEIVETTLGTMFAAGAGTTGTLISYLFFALVLSPHVQKRAQAELDLVVGRDRLPTFDDKPRLPYIEAICKELIRWQMVSPMGNPRASSEDDVYRGYFIPKGSIIIINAWAILHDPEMFPDPEEFKPERFLDKDGNFQDDPKIALAFGAGKRICPGRHLVDAIIFIVTSSILSVFNVAKARDENGHEITVKVATTVRSSLLTHPGEFQCSISPRDRAAEDLILATSLS